MTLEELRDHFVKQVAVFEAYFTSGDDDAKTAKSYRKSIAEAQARLDLVDKILLDGYVSNRHSEPVTNDDTGDLTDENF